MSDYTLLSCVESVMIEPTELYGRFALGNFTKGQSLTIANALRRCLLSQVIGCAICFVEIKGIEHEYESLPGMKESVLDVLFNLRQLTLKSDKTVFNSQLAYLNVVGPGVVRARDLKLPYFISVVNPNQHIATLSPNAKLVMKLIVNCGKTYLKHKPSTFDYKNNRSKLKQRSWSKAGYQPYNNLAYSNQWTKERAILLKNPNQTKKSKINKLTDSSKSSESTLTSESALTSESVLKPSESLKPSEALKPSESLKPSASTLNPSNSDLTSSKIISQRKQLNTLPRLFNDPLADHLQEGFNKQTKIPGFAEKAGYFSIDAIFAPILKATYTVESVNQTKEKIYFEIWTNGSIEPRQAIHNASKALIELFLPLQGFQFQMLASKAKSLAHFKPSLTLKHNESYNFKNKKKLKSKSNPQSKLTSSQKIKKKLETSITKQNEVESFTYWLRAYVKNRPKVALKIVKAVLKPKIYPVKIKLGLGLDDSKPDIVTQLVLRNASEDLLKIRHPLLINLLEERLNDKIPVYSKKALRNHVPLKKKRVVKTRGLLKLNFLKVKKKAAKKKKLTKKQRLKKKRVKEKKHNKKLLFQKSLLYFKYLILNVDVSQLNFPYNIYLGLKTNEIHNIDQLINLSSKQLKTMLQLKPKHIKFIQVTLKNYVLEHLTTFT